MHGLPHAQAIGEAREGGGLQRAGRRRGWRPPDARFVDKGNQGAASRRVGHQRGRGLRGPWPSARAGKAAASQCVGRQ
jgi:hypothetical protein